jgi:hypothetical protein
MALLKLSPTNTLKHYVPFDSQRAVIDPFAHEIYIHDERSI